MTPYAYAVWFPVIFAVGVKLALQFTDNRRTAAALAAILVVLSPFPLLHGNTMLHYLRALQGEPSVSTAIFCVIYGSRVRMPDQPVLRELRNISFALVAVGLFLFPLSLGIGMTDPYDLGFRTGFALVVGLLVLPLWISRHTLSVALTLTISLSVWMLELPESQNLWDSMIDPLGFIFGTVVILRHTSIRRMWIQLWSRT